MIVDCGNDCFEMLMVVQMHIAYCAQNQSSEECVKQSHSFPQSCIFAEVFDTPLLSRREANHMKSIATSCQQHILGDEPVMNPVYAEVKIHFLG